MIFPVPAPTRWSWKPPVWASAGRRAAYPVHREESTPDLLNLAPGPSAVRSSRSVGCGRTRILEPNRVPVAVPSMVLMSITPLRRLQVLS